MRAGECVFVDMGAWIEQRVRVAFAFDGHFATAGFRMIGCRIVPGRGLSELLPHAYWAVQLTTPV